MRRQGFTLVELMVVVAIVGLLAAVAVPTFITYLRRSRTSEVPSNLKTMFLGASTYYSRDWLPQGMGVDGNIEALANCTVQPASPGYEASSSKHLVDWSQEAESYRLLNFTPADPVYYEYHIASAGGCGNEPGSTDLYSFRARGDLDDNDEKSLFELAVGSDEDNTLYHAPGFYVEDPLE